MSEPVASKRSFAWCLLLLCLWRLFLAEWGNAEHSPTYPRNSNCIFLHSPGRVFWEGWDPQDPRSEGQTCASPHMEAQGCSSAGPQPPLPSRSIVPQSSRSALAESLETILPTCTTELSELFKDTRIFLLHSCITWLANAGRCAAAAGGWGAEGWHPHTGSWLCKGTGDGNQPLQPPSSQGSSVPQPHHCAMLP